MAVRSQLLRLESVAVISVLKTMAVPEPTVVVAELTVKSVASGSAAHGGCHHKQSLKIGLYITATADCVCELTARVTMQLAAALASPSRSGVSKVMTWFASMDPTTRSVSSGNTAHVWPALLAIRSFWPAAICSSGLAWPVPTSNLSATT